MLNPSTSGERQVYMYWRENHLNTKGGSGDALTTRLSLHSLTEVCDKCLY